jgi:uncharacterized membrane protein
MKILLFNDNPVVRKLVALSAQKTKDDLSVIWSVDEVEESGYDLVIIDDALYSDEMFESLKEHITFRSALLMATRGKAVPAGFDNVINKPFLPTDLVDMFIQIEKKFSDASVNKQEVVFADTPIKEESPVHAIDLEESLPDLAENEENLFDSFDLNELDDLGEELEFGDGIELDTLDEDTIGTAILDKEEVQEVQGLLDDTESDDWDLDDEITLSGIDESDEINLTEDNLSISDELGQLEPTERAIEELDEMNFEEDDFGSVDELGALAPEDVGVDELDEMSLAEDDLDMSDGFGEIESLKDDEDFDFEDELISTPETASSDEEAVVPEMSEDDLLLLDDEGLDDLEAQIQSAVDNMESDTLDEEVDAEDFDMPLDESILADLKLPDIDDDDQFGGLDELDMLDERELKLAIGEEVEDLPEPDEVDDEELFIPEETTYEEETDADASLPVSNEVSESNEVTHAEGVEALQALLKALSNEEVAKSLKGLNISININFGNEK